MYTDDQSKAVMDSGAHEIVHINVDGHDQQYGESTSLKTFFTSTTFSDLRDKHNIISFSKLSGRYALTDDFVFHYDGETCICKISEPETSYSGYGFLYTRYYSLPIAFLNNYLRGLDNCCLHGIFINIEHSFYLYQAIPRDKINLDRQKINVGGFISHSGEYVED